MFDLLRKKITGFTEKILGNATSEAKQNAPATENTTSTPNTHSISHENTSISPEPTLDQKIETAITEPTAQAEEITREAESEDQPANEKVPEMQALPEIKQKEGRELKTKISITQKLGGLFTGTITLQEDTVNTFLEEFEFSLLEADVEMNTATALIEELRLRLKNKTISSRENPTRIILHEIKAALHEIMAVPPFDLNQSIAGKKPGIILILGPNGAGKTTSIAKLAHHYQKQGKKIILASADTFRAGSIEQLQTHATNLNIRMVKHQYGADPAAVAFDTVKAAHAENADLVLIDTAGRQDTNKNLLEELKKIQRVIQPHAKIYVGESYTGQAILTQARTFDEAIGIDGFILTKLDTDTKGGGVISILHNLKKPILFFGVGQTYEDLVPFSMDEFLERLLPENTQD